MKLTVEKQEESSAIFKGQGHGWEDILLNDSKLPVQMRGSCRVLSIRKAMAGFQLSDGLLDGLKDS